MQTILIETKDVSKENLSDEEKEDLGLLILMQEVDWNETVSVDDVLEKLKKRRQIVKWIWYFPLKYWGGTNTLKINKIDSSMTDIKDVFWGNIVGGVIILGYQLVNIFFNLKPISPLSLFAAISMILIGIYGVTRQKKKA